NRKIESMRKEKGIGSSLEAEVVLTVNQELADSLNKLEDELRFVLITSQAKVVIGDSDEKSEIAGLSVEVTASKEAKCDRCWHRRADVGIEETHPLLCGRCVENVDGNGENRTYA
ncbi:MAG: zinc finger domain-containing protein, partial [Kangiellaceae bacterium]